MKIRVLGVVGAGIMGQGITQVALQAGLHVFLQDLEEGILKRARDRLVSGLAKGVMQGALSDAEQDEMLNRLTLTTDPSDLAAADFLIEAATEDFSVKRAVFQTVDRVCRPEVILATNTSSISITKIATTTSRPTQVIGMHFFNPVPRMSLVEVIRGLATGDETVKVTRQVAERLGKVPVEANDSPGFISSRIIASMVNEAAYLLMEGVGTVEAIDTVIRLGANHPMGPLALGDLIGLDVCLAVMRTLHEGLGDSKYRPCPLLVRMVEAGYLGRKSGRGFYTYDEDARGEIRAPDL
ncbi:MAG: 3-hydroxyacyl-CoA dehydrogenase family protein [Candidatus Methylomirabilales bacterium]